MALKLVTWLAVLPDDVTAQSYDKEVITSVIKHRRESGERQEDFLHLLLDAQKGLVKEDSESNKIFVGNFQSGSTKIKLVRKLRKVTFDDKDVFANSMLFMMAGFEPLQTYRFLPCTAWHWSLKHKKMFSRNFFMHKKSKRGITL